MFERFTERARRFIILAQEEAKRLNHSAVGTEHVLLGIIREGEGVASKVLESLSIYLERVRTEIESAIGRRERTPPDEVPFAPKPREFLSLRWVKRAGCATSTSAPSTSCWDSSAKRRGVPARMLETMGTDLERARAEVVHVLEERKGADWPCVRIRAAGATDRQWMGQVLRDHWGRPAVVGRGRVHDALSLLAMIAERAGKPWPRTASTGHECELVTLDALSQRQGVGIGLVDAVTRAAREAGCTHLWPITTNDNLDAPAILPVSGLLTGRCAPVTLSWRRSSSNRLSHRLATMGSRSARSWS